MKSYKVKTAKYQVELTNDLIVIMNADGQVIKGMTVPVLEAVERFKQMVERVKLLEAKEMKG
jgi:hypothetical protein